MTQKNSLFWITNFRTGRLAQSCGIQSQLISKIQIPSLSSKAYSEIIFQEQSYFSLHSGRSLA